MVHPIPVALFQLGWCLTGGGRVSSWCWGRASLFPTARWLFGKAGAGAFQEPGNPHPLERLVLSGVELDGWKTELKMALPGQWAGVGRKQLLLSTVQPPGACGEGDGLSPFLDGLWPRWVYLLPCTQGPPPWLGWDWWGVNVPVPGGIAVAKVLSPPESNRNNAVGGEHSLGSMVATLSLL